MTENGFTYSTLSGGLFVAINGNPGNDMEGQESAGGGVLKIVRAGGGDFTFNDIDFSAFAHSGTGSQTLMVEGFLGGLPVGTDQYTLANTNSSTSSGAYANWTTEAASVLAGKTLSELDIPLNGGGIVGSTNFHESIDNVMLTPVSATSTPEPASLALLGSGILALGWFRRRRR